ncbi:MAG: hypothetical protein WEA09_03060 [Gemmatimonadota bacterium]
MTLPLSGIFLLILLQGAADPLLPDHVLEPPGGPRIVLFSTPGEEGVAMHVSIPLEEGATEAGWGWTLQELAVSRAMGAVGQMGAMIQGRRSPWGISYLVAGPRREADHLGWILRVLLEEPTAASLDGLLNRALERAESRRETPDGRLASVLLEMLVPGALPLEGTPESLQLLSAGLLREFWYRTHQRSNMTLVVVGDVTPETILTLIHSTGAPESARAGPLDLPFAFPSPAPPPPPLRSWYGEGVLLPPATSPLATMVARLLSQRLEAGVIPGEARLDLHPLATSTALTLRGAVPPAREAELQRAVEEIWLDGATSFHGELLEVVRRDISLQLLEGSATPWGLAEQEGWLLAAGAAPGAVAAYRDSLHALDVEVVGRTLDRLLTEPRASWSLRP